MKLLFLYLKKYRVLENKSLNFDSWVRFEYSTGCLRCIKDDARSGDGFFAINKLQRGIVDSVSALIGDNGTGKTTVARAIADLICGKFSLGEFVAVVSLRNQIEDGSHYEVYYRLNGVEKLQLDGFSCNDEGCFNLNCGTTAFTLNQRLRLIYYSPLFLTERTMPISKGVPTEEPSRYSGGDDFLVQQRIAYAIRDVSMTATVAKALEETDHVAAENAVILSERKRLIKFLCDISSQPHLERKLDIPFDVKGNSIVIAFNVEFIGRKLEELRKIDDDTWIVRSRGIENVLEVETQSGWRSALTELCNNRNLTLALRIFLGFSVEYLTSFWAFSHVHSEGMTLDAREFTETFADVLEYSKHNSLRDVEDYIIDKLGNISGHNHRFSALSYLMNTARERFGDSIGSLQNPLVMQISLKDCSSDLISAYLEMMEYYLSCRGDDDFMSFTFENAPSAGETIWLSMWARLYEVFSDSINGKGRFRDVILFMDEAETALHPSWQRSLVERTMSMWNSLAPGCNVHIIFSSHSPVLLSDIPSGNVIWMNSAQEDGDERSGFNTFGANIFDLYRLAFNQKNGTTGEFASRKINEALAEVAYIVKSRVECAGTSSSPQSLNRATEQTLSQIGDPLLRKYLDGLKAGGLI